MIKRLTRLSFLSARLMTHCLMAIVALTVCSASYADNGKVIAIKPYIAKYKLFRAGKEHGSAERELFTLNSRYRLRYESNIQWMIFSDQRFETSEFIIEDNQVKPLHYKMERKGTGPDRSYQVIFNREKQIIEGPKKRRKKSRRKKAPEPQTVWNDAWLDPISYQQQLHIDLQLGKTEFNYVFINRKGLEHQYSFKVVGEELLMLPYGSVKAIKVERIYENSERQTTAWFAPQLDYALVRIWKAKSGVEQFDIQLNELVR